MSIDLRLTVFLLFVVLSAPLAGQTAPPAAAGDGAPADLVPDPTAETLTRLLEIRELTLAKRKQLEDLTKALKRADVEAKAEIEKQLAGLPESIDKLNQSFEQVAIGGIDLDDLNEQPSEEIDWKRELEQITRPILASLKDLTEKPRKIEQLRAATTRLDEQLQVVERGLASLQALQQKDPPPSVASKLQGLIDVWQRRKTDLAGAKEVVSYQLASLQGRNVSVWESVRGALMAFGQGRGLTLLIALGMGLGIWLLSRLALALVQRSHRNEPGQDRRRLNRMTFYIYRAATVVLIVIGLLAVFYVRGDLLLLALTLLGLFMLLMSLRQTLPKYLTEIRLLLDMGGIRHDERLVYAGIPLEVKSIRTFVTLCNPELEGMLRMPLRQAGELISRPCGDEPWFPTRTGDFVLFSDGRLGEVLRQTVEVVELRNAGAILQYATSDFYAMDFRNLSREGFGVAVSFGIDYSHQAECLDRIPARMRAALDAAFARKGWSDDLQDLLVAFKEAGVNSLDYLVYVTLGPRLAGSYFSVGRLVQQTLVDTCNQEGWGIPFAQLTLHKGAGFDAPPK